MKSHKKEKNVPWVQRPVAPQRPKFQTIMYCACLAQTFENMAFVSQIYIVGKYENIHLLEYAILSVLSVLVTENTDP